jgi:serine protease Do
MDEEGKKINKKKKLRTGLSIFFLVVLVSGVFLTSTIVGIRGINRLLSEDGFKFAYHRIYDGTKDALSEEMDTIEEYAMLEDQTSEDFSDNEDSQLQITDSVDSGAVVTDVTNVVETVMPSIVSITNSYYEQYMNPFDGEIYSGESQASGSGIIFAQNDTELLIVTNNHVVDGSDKLMVQFIDGELVEAQVKGVDSSVDLAVIAIQLTDIKESTINEIALARFGDSDELKVGEPAIAIGNALGYGQSVTTGVISALGRTVGDESTGIYDDLIQTDAAINPGNSGGALLNIKGEVIGINSNKIGGSSIEGMGYAIPISKATPIISELVQYETRIKIADAEKGYIGIQGADVTEEISQLYQLPVGVYVSSVYPGTGADIAGLAKGDIITELNGKDISTMEELQTELQYYAKGEVVTLKIQKYSQDGYNESEMDLELVGLDLLGE